MGTLRRPDGSTQLSYGGHPLYTYNGDVSPGVVMGQAIDQDGGLWYVLNAKGQQITTAFSVTPRTPTAERHTAARHQVASVGPRLRTGAVLARTCPDAQPELN